MMRLVLCILFFIIIFFTFSFAVAIGVEAGLRSFIKNLHKIVGEINERGNAERNNKKDL